ncbi:hypothetical protein [Taibaiella koreensis]|uniref:hypothetical protein n=1 Tax=Taibaiella koreensis TaxID=1268548 RepID=UPI0013C362D1|nr:hypothetical protein [Taibaiella koreensis]
MNSKLTDYLQLHYATPEIKQRLDAVSKLVNDILRDNKGDVSMNVITHLEEARQDKIAIQAELTNHENAIQKLKDEIFEWLSESPDINSVTVPRSNINAPTRMIFNRKDKNIELYGA